MGRYLLKGPDGDFDRWRAAADAEGVTLAAFLRNAANAAVVGVSGPRGFSGAPGPTGATGPTGADGGEEAKRDA